MRALRWPVFLAFLFALLPAAAQACPVCFGAADSSDSQALGIAIVFLLGVLAVVLGGLVAFFICLARRSQGPPSEL